jgi:hypothetical protein
LDAGETLEQGGLGEDSGGVVTSKVLAALGLRGKTTPSSSSRAASGTKVAPTKKARKQRVKAGTKPRYESMRRRAVTGKASGDTKAACGIKNPSWAVFKKHCPSPELIKQPCKSGGKLVAGLHWDKPLSKACGWICKCEKKTGCRTLMEAGFQGGAKKKNAEKRATIEEMRQSYVDHYNRARACHVGKLNRKAAEEQEQAMLLRSSEDQARSTALMMGEADTAQAGRRRRRKKKKAAAAAAKRIAALKKLGGPQNFKLLSEGERKQLTTPKGHRFAFGYAKGCQVYKEGERTANEKGYAAECGNDPAAVEKLNVAQQVASQGQEPERGSRRLLAAALGRGRRKGKQASIAAAPSPPDCIKQKWSACCVDWIETDDYHILKQQTQQIAEARLGKCVGDKGDGQIHVGADWSLVQVSQLVPQEKEKSEDKGDDRRRTRGGWGVKGGRRLLTKGNRRSEKQATQSKMGEDDTAQAKTLSKCATPLTCTKDTLGEEEEETYRRALGEGIDTMPHASGNPPIEAAKHEEELREAAQGRRRRKKKISAAKLQAIRDEKAAVERKNRDAVNKFAKDSMRISRAKFTSTKQGKGICSLGGEGGSLVGGAVVLKLKLNTNVKKAGEELGEAAQAKGRRRRRRAAAVTNQPTKQPTAAPTMAAAPSCDVGSNDSYGKRWRDYWKTRRDSQPCGNVCIYSVLMTVSKRVATGGSKTCTAQNREGCIVSGFAVVADAASGGEVKCGYSGVTNDQETKAIAGCRAMMWLADSIVRDALADVRFQIAKTIA